IGVVVTAVVYFRPTSGALRVFQGLMLIYLVIGVLGVYLHFRGNVEFVLERYPTLGGLQLVWKALRGATPALAPGALAQLGLLGLIYGYRHPALARKSATELENLD